MCVCVVVQAHVGTWYVFPFYNLVSGAVELALYGCRYCGSWEVLEFSNSQGYIHIYSDMIRKGLYSIGKSGAGEI